MHNLKIFNNFWNFFLNVELKNVQNDGIGGETLQSSLMLDEMSIMSYVLSFRNAKSIMKPSFFLSVRYIFTDSWIWE